MGRGKPSIDNAMDRREAEDLRWFSPTCAMSPVTDTFQRPVRCHVTWLGCMTWDWSLTPGLCSCFPEDIQGSRGNVASPRQSHILPARGLWFVTRSKAGEAALSWLHQQPPQLVTLCNPSEIAPRAVFTGKLFSLTRGADWSPWDLHLCRFHLNMIKRAFVQLVIILDVIKEEYGIFETSEILNAVKKSVLGNST